MIKLSDYESKSALSTPSGVRQAIKAAKLNTRKQADFISPVGDGSTRNVCNFETINALGGVSDAAVPFKPLDKGWVFYGGATLSTDWSRFGSKSVKLPTTSAYCQLTENLIQYRDCPNGWTEEFVFKMGPLNTGVNLYRSETQSATAPAFILNHNQAGKFVLYLSSNNASYDIASAVVIPSPVMVAGGVYHIAMTYDPLTSTYSLYVNGALAWTKVSSKRLAKINRKIWGWSSGVGSAINVDEFRFSDRVVYTPGFTVPTEAFVVQRGTTASIAASKDNPLELSYADGLSEWHNTVTSPLLVSAGLKPGRNYVYADFKDVGNPTIGVTQIPPEYGQFFDHSRNSLLDFMSHGETAPVAGVHVCPNAQPGIDKYGNTWITDTTAVVSRDGSKHPYLTYNNVAPGVNCTSDIMSLPENWTMEMAFMPDLVANTGTLLSLGGTGGAFGLRVELIATDTTFQYRVCISTDAVSWNVASNVLVDAGVAIALTGDQVHAFKFSYDGEQFLFETSNGASMAWPSVLPVAPGWNSVIEMGRYNGGTFYRGKVYEFKLSPFAQKIIGTLPYYSIAAGAETKISPDLHYFDTNDMKMYSSGENGVLTATLSSQAGSSIGFNTTVKRLFIGEVVLDASGFVTDTLSYAIDGVYRTGWYPVANDQDYPLVHNLGTTEIEIVNYINQSPTNTGKRQEMGLETTADGAGTQYYTGCTRERIINNSLVMSTLGSSSLVPLTGTPLGGQNQNAFYNTTVKRAF